MIYYHKIADIPVLSFTDNHVWVSLDLRVHKQVIKMIKHLMKLDVSFFLTNRFFIWRNLYEVDLPVIIESYLRALSNADFFDDIFEIGFDYIKNLTDFMLCYQCLDKLGSVFDNIVRKYYLVGETDFWNGSIFYRIKREDIREFLSGLERDIKLNILI